MRWLKRFGRSRSSKSVPSRVAEHIPLYARAASRLAFAVPAGGFATIAQGRRTATRKGIRPSSKRSPDSIRRDAAGDSCRVPTMGMCGIGRWQPRQLTHVPTFSIHGTGTECCLSEKDLWTLPLAVGATC